MLVDYGSPSPEPQRPAALPPVLDDDVDESYDPADAFGLAHAAEPVVAAAAPRAEQLIASAPEVLLLVSRVEPRPWPPLTVQGDAGGHGSSSLVTRTSDAIIFFNSTYADMSRPVEGPQNPWSDRKLEKMNTITGHVEQQAYSDLSFKEQQRSFDVLGYAANPSILTGDHAGPGLVGDLEQAFRNNGELIGERKVSRAVMRETKRKRKGKGTVGEFDDEEEEEEEPVLAEGEVAVPRVKKEKVQKEYIGPWAGWENEVIAPVAPTVEMWEDQIAAGGAPLTKKQRTKAVVESGKREVGFGEEKSVFHGASLPLRVDKTDERRCRPARLPGAIVPPHSERRRCQPAAAVAGRAGVLPTQEVHPHLERPHQGCTEDRVVPQEWPSAAECEYGSSNQGAFLPSLRDRANDPTAVGHLPRGQVSAHVHGPRWCRARRQLQQRRHKVPQCLVRPTDEALGHRDG